VLRPWRSLLADIDRYVRFTQRCSHAGGGGTCGAARGRGPASSAISRSISRDIMPRAAFTSTD